MKEQQKMPVTKTKSDIKIALKRFRCYECSGVIAQGELYRTFLQFQFLKLHYPQCPAI